MKKSIIILGLLVLFVSCTKDNNKTEFYYFNDQEQNLLGFTLNDSISFVDNLGVDNNFRVIKDSLYHREFNAIVTGTSFVQHNNIWLVSTDTNNYFIRIDAEKATHFEYLMEIGESPYNKNTYFNYGFNSSIQNFEVIDTVIDGVPYSGLYALRFEQSIPLEPDTKSLILLNSENGIVLIEKIDENNTILMRLRKK